ncbi:MAG: hypothetical protein HWD59_08180 [Coxiellaceae bacterium]|nr:MAG: hypothetical protein HWD59_08180 [Coxiellaceae bacterium]
MLHSSNYYQQIEVQLEKTLNFEEFSALIDMLALYSHAWLSNQLTLPPYLKRLNQLIAINWFELMQDKIMPWQKYSEFCQTLVTLVGEYNPDTATPKLINLLLEFFQTRMKCNALIFVNDYQLVQAMSHKESGKEN